MDSMCGLCLDTYLFKSSSVYGSLLRLGFTAGCLAILSMGVLGSMCCTREDVILQWQFVRQIHCPYIELVGLSLLRYWL